MKDTSQSGYVWAPPGPYEVQRVPRRPLRLRRLLVLVPFLVPLTMVFGVSYLVMPAPAPTLQPGAGFATVAGKEIALVPYQRDGSRGVFQLLSQDMFQSRLAAVELTTGRSLWDVQLSDKLSWRVRVLATGNRLAYLSTDDGLHILQLDTGAVVAKGEGIPGLPKAVLSRAAYGYDQQHRSVVALDVEGRTQAIVLDSDTATPAPPELKLAWAGKLSAPRSITTPATGSASVAMLSAKDAKDVVQLRLRGNAPGQTLAVRGQNLGEAVFHDGQFPLTPPPGEGEPEGFPTAQRPTLAAGAPAGLVVVHHARDINAKDRALSVVSLDTGQVVSTLPTGTGQARALTSPSGHTLIYTRADSTAEGLALVGPDGRISWAELGQTDFFGNPA